MPLIVLSSAVFFTSCDDEDAPKTIPEVTTSAISNITTTSATGGGNIVSDGNAEITAMGLVYSSTDAMPTLDDSKTIATSSSAAFTSELTGLTSGTIYHVRAYATNSVGTAYGTVVDFTSGNSAPIVTDVVTTGDININAVLTASYAYSDAEGNPESGTTFQWYSASDAAGTGEIAIPDATASTYTILATDEFKYIRVGITPKTSVGTLTGLEVRSDFVGPVPEAPETVTFDYNGQSVTYEIIVSTVTGRKWMDRNLGASQAATSFDDYKAYGDLFQWGRAADGHQLITWGASSGEGAGSPVNGTTTTQSTTDSPGHSLFIYYSASASNPTTVNWREPQNDNLWKSPNYSNNPCPSGWHIPTSDEWVAENVSLIADAFGQLKITAAGDRRPDNGQINNGPTVGWAGYYWSSTTSTANVKFANSYQFFPPDVEDDVLNQYARRMAGYSCRCIKDEE